MATMKSITASGSRLEQLKRLALVLAKNKLAAPAISISSLKATVTTPSGAEEVRYTVDGTDPRYSDSAKVYAAPVTLTAGTTIRTAAFAAGKFTSDLAEASC